MTRESKPHRDAKIRPARARSTKFANTKEFAERFMLAAERGNVRVLISMLDGGFPVNYQEPRSGDTALHAVAASRARPALRVLLQTGECNFVVYDHNGRLPSNMAYIYGKDPAMARLLAWKERTQAKRDGVKLRRRPDRR